jgi:hypothetical protein
LKDSAPATLRAREVAIGPSDVEALAIAFRLPSGAAPVARAKAIEEGFGPKTVELVCVPTGAAPLSSATLDEVSTYFNGDPLADPPIPKRIVANQEVTAVNFLERVIDITADVYASGVTAEAIENGLRAVFDPVARSADGDWVWAFGARVPTSRIVHEIFKIDSRIKKVDLALPASSINLLPRELPRVGAIDITIFPPV